MDNLRSMKHAKTTKWRNPTGTKTYYAWRNMCSRCTNPRNASFAHYGERGIEVCAAWVDDYDQFVSDMGEAPTGMTLDRINNDLGYSKSNCRWATLTEQLNNQRRNVRVTAFGKTQTLGQWAAELSMRYDTLWRRLSRGLSAEGVLARGHLAQTKLVHGTRSGYEHFRCRCDECRAFNSARAKRYRGSRS